MKAISDGMQSAKEKSLVVYPSINAESLKSKIRVNQRVVKAAQPEFSDIKLSKLAHTDNQSCDKSEAFMSISQNSSFF